MFQLGKGFFLLDWGQKTSKPAGNNPVLLPGFINSGGLRKGGQGGGIPEWDKKVGGNWEWFYVGMAPEWRSRFRAVTEIREKPKPPGREGKQLLGLLGQRGRKSAPFGAFRALFSWYHQSVKGAVFGNLGKVFAQFTVRFVCIYHYLRGLLGTLLTFGGLFNIERIMLLTLSNS